MSALLECVATCRPGLESILAQEVESLGGTAVSNGKRAVYFSADKATLYRLNMAVRTAIQILVPIRTFNARDYDLLYFQARRTNWHQLFTTDKTIRIDVNGRSPNLRNTQYVVHRIKDGIVDTFRKLSDGVRPSIDKAEPEIHVVAHLDRDKVTLCLDSSGVPLFKRGYRLQHGEAPIKEDLAAGMLLLAGADQAKGIIDPMCGSGTFLFEGYMLSHGIAPNLNRSFAFQHWLDYDAELFEKERLHLENAASRDADFRLMGMDEDPDVIELAQKIQETAFAKAQIEWTCQPFQRGSTTVAGALMITNPPYGQRLGDPEEMGQLYRDLGELAKQAVPSGKLAVFTTNRKAARQIRMKADQTWTLFNGQLEGTLYRYEVR